MLNHNSISSFEKLFKKGDFNVRTTIANFSEFRSKIEKTIGREIVTIFQYKYIVKVTIILQTDIIISKKFASYGTSIVNEALKNYNEESIKAIRFDISRLDMSHKKSCIIIKE